MPRDMFGEVTNPAPRLGSQSWYTVPLSIAAHALLAAAVVIVPLMASDLVPTPRTMMSAFTAAAELPDPPPPPVSRSPQATVTPAATSTAVATEASDRILPEAPPAGAAPGPDVLHSIPGGVDGGVGLVTTGTVPPPVPPPAPAQLLRVGGKIKEPTKLRHVPPVYPAIAQQARVGGLVIIEATIGTDGHVKDARVLRSQPLLDEAALSAVRQWVFTPTTLNGVPVPVVMTVTVNFKLE